MTSDLLFYFCFMVLSQTHFVRQRNERLGMQLCSMKVLDDFNTGFILKNPSVVRITSYQYNYEIQNLNQAGGMT